MSTETGRDFLVTLAVTWPAWDSSCERQIKKRFARLRPMCQQRDGTVCLTFAMRADSQDSACSLMKRSLLVHAAVYDWWGFRIQECVASCPEARPR